MSENLRANVLAFPSDRERALRRVAKRFPGATTTAVTPEQDMPMPKDVTPLTREQLVLHIATVVLQDTATKDGEEVVSADPQLVLVTEVEQASEDDFNSAVAKIETEPGALLALTTTPKGFSLRVWEPNS